MEAIQVAVEQILTFVPQIVKKGLQFVGPRCGHLACTHVGAVPSLQECLCCYWKGRAGYDLQDRVISVYEPG